MSISLVSVPNDIELCGNEVKVVLNTDLALSTPNLQLECLLYVELVYNSGVYTLFASKKLSPDANGDASFFWEQYLLDSFENSFDSPSQTGSNAFQLTNATKRYRLAGQEWSGANQSTTDYLTTGAIVQIRTAYNGRIAKSKRTIRPFFGGNNWNQLPIQNGGRDSAFLDWRSPTTKTNVFADQWLYFLYDRLWSTFFGVASPEVRVKYYRSDGTSVEYSHQSITVSEYDVWGIPAGFDQLGLTAYETPDFFITKYEVYVGLLYTGNYLEMTERKTFYVDRNFYANGVQLHYLNSFNVLVQFQFNGALEKTTSVKRQLAPTYWQQSGLPDNPEIITHDVQASELLSCSTGTINRVEANRLRELIASKKVFMNTIQGYAPVCIKTKSISIDQMTNVFKYDIEFYSAFDESTPDMFL